MLRGKINIFLGKHIIDINMFIIFIVYENKGDSARLRFTIEEELK